MALFGFTFWPGRLGWRRRPGWPRCGWPWQRQPQASVFQSASGTDLTMERCRLRYLGFWQGRWGSTGWFGEPGPLVGSLCRVFALHPDASVTLAKRALRGEKVWQAHRSRYYQRLVRLGHGHRSSVAGLCLDGGGWPGLGCWPCPGVLAAVHHLTMIYLSICSWGIGSTAPGGATKLGVSSLDKQNYYSLLVFLSDVMGSCWQLAGLPRALQFLHSQEFMPASLVQGWG